MKWRPSELLWNLKQVKLILKKIKGPHKTVRGYWTKRKSILYRVYAGKKKCVLFNYKKKKINEYYDKKTEGAQR